MEVEVLSIGAAVGLAAGAEVVVVVTDDAAGTVPTGAVFGVAVLVGVVTVEFGSVG